MAKRREITVVGYVPVAWNEKGEPTKYKTHRSANDTELTPEEAEAWDRRMTYSLSRTMSEYYSQHPQEAELLEEVSEERKRAFYEKFPELKRNRCNNAADT